MHVVVAMAVMVLVLVLRGNVPLVVAVQLHTYHKGTVKRYRYR